MLLLSQEPSSLFQSCVSSEGAGEEAGILEKLFHMAVAPLPVYLAGSCATSAAHQLEKGSERGRLVISPSSFAQVVSS